jgi:hypothetical protein
VEDLEQALAQKYHHKASSRFAKVWIRLLPGIVYRPAPTEEDGKSEDVHPFPEHRVRSPFSYQASQADF